MDAFRIKEISVMRELGINDRDVMRQVRIHALGKEGTFWKNEPGRGVLLTEEGKERMIASVIDHTAALAGPILSAQKNAAGAFPAPTPPRPLSQSEKTPPEPNPELGALLALVVRPQFHANRHIVTGLLEDGSPVSVRVKDARLFLPRSRTGAFLVLWSSAEDRYVFAGKPEIASGPSCGWSFSVPARLPDPPHCPRSAGQW